MAAEQKNLTDCYWFLNKQCKKGEACEYRHCEGALENPTVCKFWTEGKCSNADCMFRHPSGVQGKQDRSQTQCFYFSQGKCTKGESCPFSHAVGGSQDQNLEKQKEKEEAELRKLQLARKKEEERLAKLKAQGEELERRNQLKRKKEEQGQQQKPAAKLEKKAAPQERQPGVGTFVKSLDQILKKDEKPKPKAAKQQIASELKKPQKKAAAAEKKAAAVEKKPAPVEKKPAPEKKKVGEKATQEPSGPVNFGIKTLDQILKEKAAGGGGVKVEENLAKAAPSGPAKAAHSGPAKAKKTPEATNSGSYLDELRKKNQQKFGQPASSVEKADPEPEPEARGNTSPKRKKIEEPQAQKTETKKQKVEQPPPAASAGNLKKSMSMDEFDKELDEFANMDGVSATTTSEMTEMASDDDFDKEFNELQDLIK